MPQYIGDTRAFGDFNDWVCFCRWRTSTTQLLVSADGRIYALSCPSIEVTPHLQEIENLGATVLAVSGTNDASRISITTLDRQLTIFDILEGEFGLEARQVLVATNPSQDSSVSCLNHDGTAIACATTGANVAVWHVRTALDQYKQLDGLSHPAVLRFGGNNSDILVCGGEDGSVLFWRMQAASRSGDLAYRHNSQVCCIEWSRCGTFFASGSRDTTIIVFNAAKRKVVNQLRGASDWVTALQWGPTASHLASGAFQSDRRVSVWHVESEIVVRTFTGHSGGITALNWSAKGELLTSCGADMTVRMWDVELVTEATVAPIIDGHDDNVRSVCWSPTGSMLVSGADDNTARVWNADTGELMCVLSGCQGWVNFVAFAPDNDTIACACGDKTVRLFKVSTAASIAVLQHTDWVQTVAWNAQGTELASGSFGECSPAAVWIWDGSTHKLICKYDVPAGYVNSVAWNADGTLLACGTDDASLIVWDRKGGQQLRAYSDTKGAVRCVAWSPRGNTVAAAWESSVRLYDVEEAISVASKVFTGHTAIVHSVAWSPDSTCLLSSCQDRTVRVWALTGATQDTPAFLLDSAVFCLAWHPVGGVSCACANGRIIQLGVVGSARSGNQLKWNKSFRQSKRIEPEKKVSAPLPPIIEDETPSTKSKSKVCTLL